MTDNNGVCPQNGLPCKEVIELVTKVDHLEKQQDDTKIKVEGLATNVRDIIEFQGGTKVYVAEIKQQLSSLETRLFAFMGDLVNNLTKKEAKQGKDWMELIKYVLAITLGAIIAYIFKN